MLALETLPPPRLRKTKRLEFLFVFFLRDGAVFEARHGFAGFVHVRGPSFAGLGGFGGGFGELGVLVRFGFRAEEGFGFLADGHDVVVSVIVVVLWREYSSRTVSCF